ENFGGTSVLDTIAYDGFGKVINETSAANGDREKFTAREWDSETGLQYNRGRYYDSWTGRWISQDPIGFRGGDRNLYRYVSNSPVNYTDPSGQIVWFVPIVFGLAVAGLLAFPSGAQGPAPGQGWVGTPVLDPVPAVTEGFPVGFGIGFMMVGGEEVLAVV